MASPHDGSQFERPSPVEKLFLSVVAPSGACDAERLDTLCARQPEFALELRALAEQYEVARRLLANAGGLSTPLGPELSSELTEALRPRDGATARYEVRGEIGRGAMGAIFAVWDAELRRVLALKMLLADRGSESPEDLFLVERRRSRLIHEAQVLAQLEHPGIVPIHDVGTTRDGRPYFTMQLVRGQHLGDVIRELHAGRKEWGRARVLGVLQRVCEAVAYAHSKGVIHRDLKPANVMVGPFGEAYVMDWGLARVSGKPEAADIRLREVIETWRDEHASSRADAPSSLVLTQRTSVSEDDSPLRTLDGDVVGTPSYMAPEQARGKLDEVDARSDVYSVGAMLYHVLCAQAPYSDSGTGSTPHAVLLAVRERGPTRLPQLAHNSPEELVAIVEKAMARERERRYASVVELADDLRAYLEGRVVRAHRTGALIELRKWTRRNKGAAAAIAAVVVGLGATATVQSLLKRDVERAREQTLSSNAELREQNYFNSIAFAASAWRDGKCGRMRELLDRCPVDLRGWEWRFLDARVDASDYVIKMPAHRARHVAFTPDGCSVVTGVAAVGGELDIVDPTGVQRTLVIDRSGSFNASFSSDGTTLLVQSGGSRVLAWDVDGWRRRSDVVVGMPEDWPGVLCSPTDNRFALAGPAPIEIRELPSGELVSLLETGQGHSTVSWSQDGQRLVTGGHDGSVAVWDSHTFERLQFGQEHEVSVDGAGESPDARWIASAGSDGRLLVWDAQSMKVVQRRQPGPRGGFVWSPDSTLLAIASEPGIQLLDVPSWIERVRLTGHNDFISSLAFDASGERLVSASFDGEIRIWNVRRADRWPVAGGVGGRANALHFSRDGQWLFVPWWEQGVVEIWSVRDRQLTRTLHMGSDEFADVSDDGARTLIKRARQRMVISDSDSGAVLGEIANERIGSTDFDPNGFEFSPDGRRIALRGDYGGVGVWDADSLTRLWFVDVAVGSWVFPFRLGGGQWSPDGERIVTLTFDGAVDVWRADSGALEREWRVRGAGGQRACFSPDSRGLFISGGTVSGVECWDVDSGECLWEYASDFATSLHVGSNGDRLFCPRAGAVDVRDTRTGALIASLELDPQLESGFAASPVEDLIVTASATGLRFWDTTRSR